MHGNGFYRFARYLMLWAIGLLVLCILAFIKHWDTVKELASELTSSLISTVITFAVIVVIIRALFR